MAHLGYHIRTHLADGSVIARDARERRIVAQVVLDQGRDAGLHTFSLPDAHLHLGADCAACEPGELSRRIAISLKKRLDLRSRFEMYPLIMIRDQDHLEKVVRYILTQHDRHGVLVDPFRESTNLPDLLGLRVIGGDYTQLNLRRLLPRLTRDRVLRWFGFPELRPADQPLACLVEATCRAVALPDLRGSQAVTVAARRAAVAVARSRLSTESLAALLGVAPRTVQWLRKDQADPAVVRAIQLQLAAQAALDCRPVAARGKDSFAIR
jgi:hypothetical protein